jgi:hypothetical protein
MAVLNKLMARGIVPRRSRGPGLPARGDHHAGPIVLDFDSTAATVIAVAFGAGAAVLAVGTAWPTGIVKVIPPLLHGYADIIVTVALILLPFILGFDDSTAALLFYEIVGGAGLLATLATRFESHAPEARAMTSPQAA